MASLSACGARHGVVDDRPGHYLCFPDLLALPGGRVLCAYREADRHVASRRRLLARMSDDGGAAWGPVLEIVRGTGHCPRLSSPAPGLLCAIDDDAVLHASRDQGRTWGITRGTGMAHGVADRILALPDGTWLTTAHRHLPLPVDPTTGQRPTEQIVFASDDQGRHWTQRSALAAPGPLVLCEAALTALPDGRLLALLRENSHVGEPLYRCESSDGGRTWSAPEPTPLIGHRPTPGLTRDGRLLVTYRDTGPDGGTSAWLGREEDLRGFAPHGSHSHAAPCPLTPQGLYLGGDGKEQPLHILRPLTAPGSERAGLEADVHCLEGCAGLRLGGWWRITPHGLALLPDTRQDAPRDSVPRPLAETPLTPDRPHNIRLEWRPGLVEAYVDGERRVAVELPADDVRRRPVLFGALPGAAGRSLWQSVRQTGNRPGGASLWSWTTADGQPDARVRREVLQLAAAPGAAWCDYGYSGWAEVSPGQFLCAYHHASGREPGYEPGSHAHVRCTRFSIRDF